VKLTYDPEHNIAYFRLHEKKGRVDTVRVSDELNVDIAPDGTVYGIEQLNANAQLEAEDGGNPVIINEAVGQRQEMPLLIVPLADGGKPSASGEEKLTEVSEGRRGRRGTRAEHPPAEAGGFFRQVDFESTSF
jgi:uncharacterized protein YuzE